MQEIMIGQEYRAPGRFVDSDSPQLTAFARAASAGAKDATDAVLRLYCAVRDEILYDAYVDWTDPNVLASEEPQLIEASSQPLHSIENLGSVVYQAYRVEIKPTTKVAVAKPNR